MHIFVRNYSCKKKYLALFLVLLFTFSSCNGKKVDQNIESDPNTANPSVEITIYNIFQGDEEDKIKAEKILDQIDCIDWTVYASVSNHQNFELLDFLEEYLPDSDTEKKVNFFKATTHLDTSYAEKYCCIVGDLFLQDQIGTIGIISRLDPSKYEEMIGFILYCLAYTFSDEDYENTKTQLEELKKTDNITESEKKVIDLFLQNIESEMSTANPSVEVTIYNIFQGDEENKVKAEEILDQIDCIDWKVYWSITDDLSTDGPPSTFKLMDFLGEYISDSDMGTDKKVNFFKATKNLDAAYAEEYSSVVGDLFLQDKKSTISLISQIDPSKYEEMIGFILYRLSDYTFSDEELDKIRDQVVELKKTDITDSEKKVIDVFLNKMAEERGKYGIL